MKLVLTKQSKSDLDDIWDYIAQDNPDIADTFIDQIYEKCLLLADTPTIGRERPELMEGIRSFPNGKYLIFYHTKEETILIDRVLSGYRDLPAVFDE